MTVAASSTDAFRLEGLQVWTEVVNRPEVPKGLGTDMMSVDLQEAEEHAAKAKFAEVKAKLAVDCQVMTEYNIARHRWESQKHVRKVVHFKAQEAIGKKNLF